MKAVLLALVLGVFLNMSVISGQVYPLGSVVAIVIMGVWIKSSMDKHFEELSEQLKNGKGRAEEKEESYVKKHPFF